MHVECHPWEPQNPYKLINTFHNWFRTHFSLDGFTPNPRVMKQPGMSSTKVLSGLKLQQIDMCKSGWGIISPRRVEKKQKKLLETKPRTVDLWNFKIIQNLLF